MDSNNIILDNSLLKEKENKKTKNKTKIFIDIVNNWEDYIKNNKDLKENGIDTVYKAFEHYIKFGNKEGRVLKINTSNVNLLNDNFTKTYQYSFIKLYEEYDWDKYIKIHDDLNKSNYTNLMGCIHYIKFGINENRPIEKKKINLKNDLLPINNINNINNNNNNNNNKININTILNKINHTNVKSNINKKDNLLNNNSDSDSDSDKNSEDSNSVSNDSNSEISSDSDSDSDSDINSDSEYDSDSDISKDSDIKNIVDNKIDNKIDKNDKNDKNNNNNIGINNKLQENIEDKQYFLNNNDLILNFNYEYYKILNKDLNLNNELEYINHFLKIGKNDSRPYSKEHLYKYYNYDWNKFINDYQLIEIKSNEEALHYYLKNNNKDKFKIYTKFDKKYFNIQFFKEYYNLNDSNIDEDQLYDIFLMMDGKNKIYFNHSNYFIYNLIDWKKFYDNNNLTIENDNKILYYYFMNHFSDYKNNFKIDFNFDYLESITDFSDLMYNDLDKFIKYLLFNIKLKDNTYFNNLLLVNKYLTKFDKKYKILDIPLLFEFNNNNNITKNMNEFLHYTFIIYSYNVENNLYNNLLSILYQNYKNWNIIYINNNSTDNTQKLLDKFIQEFDLNDKIKVIHLKEKKSETNIKYDIYQELDLNTICVLLNGNNWLSSDNVLIEANNKFIKTNHLLLYSGYNILNNDKIENIVDAYEYEDDIKNNILYRKHYSYEYDYLLFTSSNLLKQIPKKYYFNNNWIDNCNNLIDFICLLELSSSQISTFNNILYIVDKTNNMEPTELIKNSKLTLENYIRKMDIIQKYIPPIYNFNLEQNNILKIMQELQLSNYFVYDNENKKNNSIVDFYKYINTYTNYDHIFIMNKPVKIHKYFNIYYKINNVNLMDKDFIGLGYNINLDTFNKLSKNNNNKNNEFLELGLSKEDNYLNDIYCYICSRKYRNFIIKNYNNVNNDNNDNDNKYINFINNFRLQDSENYIENNLTFYIYNKNLFIIDVKNEKDIGDNYYEKNNININNYLL